ncbi:hypothetical protein AKJ60_00335 [candidate division MSBL1 archaeon SCGC-AAA385M11]|nr:hypothetical protein AKJ60_00335 [candidate division MSBL1 archaeon SCGC-AAA385M11]
MLRDCLTAIEGVATWPCDEINYIWRHGNRDHPTDEFPSELVSPYVRRYIRNKFAKLSKRYSAKHVVEKTCANSLRVGFVDEVLPEAKCIFLVRDGRDVVASALKRWKASLELGYILKKARFVPFRDVPYYSINFITNRIYKIFSQEKRLSSWGPIFFGMSEMLQYCELPEICAIQWQRCVERSSIQLNKINNKQVLYLSYEEFVSNPDKLMHNILDFLDIKTNKYEINNAIKNVSGSSIGTWKDRLSEREIEVVTSIIKSTLNYYGYL